MKLGLTAIILLLASVSVAGAQGNSQLGGQSRGGGLAQGGSAQQRNCGASMQMCRPGSNGNGGCYNMAYAQCYDGRICQQGMTLCRKGSKGSGGCYNMAYARCEQGRIRLN